MAAVPIGAERQIRLPLYTTRDVINLQTLGPGTYEQQLYTEGNSLLSTVHVTAADPGASVTVRYWDFGIGFPPNYNERVDLDSHAAVGTAGESDRILVTRLHNKPVLEVEVTGGNVTFGVYVTVVASFASDLDSALHKDGDTADLSSDKGLPIMCLDEANNEFRILRCEDGAIAFTPASVTTLSSGEDSISYEVTAELQSYTVAGEARRVSHVIVGGDGNGEFSVKINGTEWAKVRSNVWNAPQVVIPFGNKRLAIGDEIKVEATNCALGKGVCNYESFIHLI